jgi:hypothetical protein
MGVQGAQHCILDHDDPVFFNKRACVRACAICRARLSFNFLDCPACNVRIEPDQTPYLKDLMQPHLKMEEEVKRKATQRLRESEKIVELQQKGGKVQADEEERISALAMRRFNYYPCSRYVDPLRSPPSQRLPRTALAHVLNVLRVGVTTYFSAVKPNVEKGETVRREMVVEKMKVRKITMQTSWCVGRAPLRVKLHAVNTAQSSLSTSADFAAKKAT